MKERTKLRLKLLANGYVPLLNHGKVTRLDGWPDLEVTEELIRSWDRSRHASTGIRIEGGLGVVDVDVEDPAGHCRAKRGNAQLFDGGW
jgi:hypothetical protein